MSDIDDLKSLLRDDALKSMIRILILISLALNDKMYFTDLLTLTNTGKGSLSNHLDILLKYGYIKDKNVFTIGGPRRILEITEKGKTFYQDYTEIISKLHGAL